MMFLKTSARSILLMTFFLKIKLQTAKAFVCFSSSARGIVARLEPKAKKSLQASGPMLLGGSCRRQNYRRFFMAGDRVDNMRQAEGNQPAKKNLFDYIVEEDVEVLRRYVDSGGNVHVADALGDTAMLMAAGTGNVEVVKILASAEDADVNYACFHGGETPLMLACTRGYLAVAEYLVNEVGANVNAVNHRGDTALNLAAYWGKVKCVRFLLGVPNINTEIENVQGKRAGEDMQELMRDKRNDAETLDLLRASRIKQGLTR